MKIELVENWHKAWKFASVWVFGAIGAFPDIYNGVAAMGWLGELPAAATWSIRALAVAGIAARVIKRKLAEPQP